MKQATTTPLHVSPLTWKLLKGITAGEIYDFLETEVILPEQKECRRESKGTGDQLYIYKMLLQEKRRI